MQVGVNLLPELHKTVKIEARLSAYHMVRRPDGRTEKLSHDLTVPDLRVHFQGMTSCEAIRTRWSGRNFEYAGSCDGYNKTVIWVFKLAGTLDASGTWIETATFSQTTRSGSGDTIVGFTIRDVPLWGRPTGFGGCMDLKSLLGGPKVQNHVSGINFSMPGYTYAGTDWNHASHSPTLSVQFLCPR